MINFYNEDSLKFMHNCDDNIYDGCFTSPPYNANLRINNGKYISRGVDKRTNKYNNFTDDLTTEDYFQWSKNIINELLRVCSGYIFYNIQMLTGNKEALFRLIGFFYKEIKEIIIWDKIRAEPAIGECVLNSRYEFIIVFSKNESLQRKFNLSNFKRGTIDNVFSINKNKGNSKYSHSAGMPLTLCNKILENFFKPNQKLIEPFGGATAKMAIACHDFGIDLDYIEIDKKYHNSSKKLFKIHSDQGTFFNV